MRLLHTSDWHLGRRLHGVALQRAHELYLDHLVEVVRSERVDAVLLAGDVYDRAVPPPESTALFDDALTRVVDAGAQVVVSSGNHDSAVRLGFGAGLLSRAGVRMCTTTAGVGKPVLVGDVAVYALPYLEPAVAGDDLGAAERTHAGTLRAAMARVRADAAARGHAVVVSAHAFVAGGLSSESERDISVGGVSAVPPEVFAGADLVALGHLHGAQTLAETVRYSGSPVAMSFGEVGQVKGSYLWDIESGPSGARVRGEFVTAPVERPLRVLRGELADLLGDPALLEAEAAYCQVVLTDPVRPEGALDRVRARFPHTLRLEFQPSGTAVVLPHPYADRTAERGPVEVCDDFLGHVRGGRGASPAERAVLVKAFDAARLERAEVDDSARRVVGAARGVA